MGDDKKHPLPAGVTLVAPNDLRFDDCPCDDCTDHRRALVPTKTRKRWLARTNNIPTKERR